MLCDYRVFICARLGLTAGFLGAFLLGVFVVHPKIVFAIFDFMAERTRFVPITRTHARNDTHPLTRRYPDMHAKTRTH
jgi:hypothetical protein